MDAYDEKKWFVYMGDHHEGPFSLGDMQSKMSQGQVSTASYVWAEGMADWKLMTEVTAFGSILANGTESAGPAAVELQQVPSAFATAVHTGEVRFAEEMPSAASAGTQSLQDAMQEPVQLSSGHLNPTVYAQQKIASASESARHRGQELDLRPHVEMTNSELKSLRGRMVKRRMRRILFLLLLIGGGYGYFTGKLDPFLQHPLTRATAQALSAAAEPLLGMVAEKAPFLARWISPIPLLDDVSPAEYAELKSAASGELEQTGPKVNFALSTGDPLNPVFHVASNLPDGTSFRLFIEGVPDTLMNQLGFSGKTEATLQRRLGSTQHFKTADGKPLARGQYQVYLVESEQQPPAAAAILKSLQPLNPKAPATLPKGFKLLASRSYFLGGIKDATYAQRLKEFHDRLREKASNELTELKQFALLLEGQLSETATKFNQLRGAAKAKAGSKRKKDWTAYHEKWRHFTAQMNDSFKKWPPTEQKNEFFYGMLYDQVQQTFRSVDQVHGFQNTFFTTTTDPTTFEIQFGEAQSVASSAVAALKAKVDQAEKVPPTPNGMPRKDGL